MESNKVKVKIFGQEYVISGEKSREEIIQVAAHVDTKMQEISDMAKGSGFISSNLGVLAAINIASEYFQALEELEENKRMNMQLEKDAQGLFTKMYENMQAAQGGAAGPDMSGFTGAADAGAASTDGGNDDNVVDGDFREV